MMMNPSKPDTRIRLHEAALYLVAREGPGASVRAIARRAGVTEGALYRHYKNRDALLAAVFFELVEPMVTEKENLVAMRAPVRDRLREWVRCTYARFDDNPDAFAYIFLTDHDFPREHARLSGRQSELARQLLEQGRSEGVMRPMDPELAAAIFVGLLLGVPERVRSGRLTGPASRYTDEISRAIWLALAGEKPPTLEPDRIDRS
jgi:AcrR family transcriptional regulator